jgi:hypothetical protein
MLLEGLERKDKGMKIRTLVQEPKIFPGLARQMLRSVAKIRVLKTEA